MYIKKNQASMVQINIEGEVWLLGWNLANVICMLKWGIVY